MAITVTPGLVAGALTTFRTIFNNAFDAASNLQPWRRIAMEVNSTSDSETHHWLGTVPAMVDVTHDTLHVEPLYAMDYTIQNNTYKAAFEVPRAFFEDEKLGLVTPKINQLAQEAARHPGQLIFQTVINNPLAFDGVAFISGSHVIGSSGTIDNDIAGSGITVAAFQTDLGTARGTMREFADDQGRPMNTLGNVIMVPAELEQIAFQAVNGSLVPGSVNLVAPAGGDGTFAGSGYTVIVNPYLTDATDWYLLSVNGGFAPFIYQTRVAPTLEPLADGSANAVFNDKFIYSVRARYNVGVGDPRHIVRVVNS